MGQTGRALLQEAAVREEGAAHDEGGDVHPLWGQREDKQVQVREGRGQLVGCGLASVLQAAAPQEGMCNVRAYHDLPLRAYPTERSTECAPSHPFLHLCPAAQSLLEMVSVGAASMEELQQRLEAELAALEVSAVFICKHSWRAAVSRWGVSPIAALEAYASSGPQNTRKSNSLHSSLCLQGASVHGIL